MNDIQFIKLQNGAYVGISVMEISAIPLQGIAGGKNRDTQNASDVFEEIINVVSSDVGDQDAAVELLSISRPAKGQVVAAQTLMYLILRKYGRNQAAIADSMSVQTANCLNILKSVAYTVRTISYGNVDFTAALSDIHERQVVSLERIPHVLPVPILKASAWYIESFAARQPLSYSRVYDAMAQCPHTAFSICLIPARFTTQERAFIQQMLYWLDAPTPGGSTAIAKQIDDYYHRQAETSDNMNYLISVTVMGERTGVQSVASKLKACLESGSGGMDLQQIDWSGLPIPYTRDFPFWPWNMTTQSIKRFCSIKGASQAIRRFPFFVSHSECISFFRLPVDDGGIRGIHVNRIQETKEIFSDKVMREDNIRIGHFFGHSEAMFGAPLNEFTRHALVVGMPGTGKTTFAVNLLLQFYKRGIPFLAIEPTKAEYRAMIDSVPELQVFTPGKNAVVPFIMNPFLPPDGISLETFKPSLVSAFKAAFSMPSPLDILFAKALDNCYIQYGWRSYSKAGDADVDIFGLHEFVLAFREVIKDSNYSAESKGNMESAGVFRLLNLIVQNGNIYDTINSVPLQDILRRPTVIELNAIDNQEQKALIMALLLIQIILYTKHMQKGDGKLKNILLIDEAHVLLGGGAATQEGAAEAGASTVKALQNMIVEIRSYGTGIIIADQSPQKVTKEIVGNTDIKVMFQLVQAEDKSIIANASNMSEDDMNELSRLNTGEAYAYYRGLTAPQRIMTEDIRASEGICLSVSDEEIHTRMRYWDARGELLMPYISCRIGNPCTQCDFNLRDDAQYYTELLFSKEKREIDSKQKLFGAIVSMSKRLQPLVGEMPEDRYKKLLHCVRVKYIRKATIETKVVLSKTEIERVLSACE